MFRNTLVLVLTSLLIAGCSRKEDDSAAGAASDASPSSASDSSVQDPGELPKPDRAKPLAEYSDINSDPMLLTYVVTAKSAGTISDEDKLNRLSTLYFNERDAFKKQELAKQELPRITAMLERARSHDYYSVPVGAQELTLGTPTPVQVTSVGVRSYEIASGMFPLESFAGVYCWSVPLRNEQGANLQVVRSEFPCALPISDQNQAKAIEAARSQNALDLRGTLYLFAPRAENGTAKAVVAHAHLELINTQTKEVLGSVDL
jgi:hypothetical protein